jgi:hypothetical protein
MSPRRSTVLLLLLPLGLLVAAAQLLTGSSTALLTFSTTNAASTVAAASDWTPPTVSVLEVGTSVKDTVQVTANAADAESGIASVTLAHRAVNGSSWVTLCTVTSAPYSCSWNTRTVTDGSYDLRAVATDRSGYTTTSGTVRTFVANTFTVVLGDPGDAVRGTVALPVSVTNPGTSSTTVRVEYLQDGASSWRTICSNLSAPYSCTWSTTSVANDYYDLRAVATSGGSTYTSLLVTDVLVDNLAPTVAMTDPGSPLSGTRRFAATATDEHSGVAAVTLQYAASGSPTTWKQLCSLTDEPFTCRVDTAALPDGGYSFRAVATDLAGNSTTSSVVTNRVVDNTVSSVSLEDPGAFLTGTVTLRAAASSTAGVTSVRIQRAPSGTTTWTDVCTATSAPYSCSWNTTQVADGTYDLRAVLTDGAGRTTVSSTVAARRVSNSPLRALDVQTANGGTAGRADAGDTVTLTYSRAINLATVTPGWNGSAQAVSVRLQDGALLGLGNKGDTLDVQRSGSQVNLGSVNLREDFVKRGKTAVVSATMTAGTTTIDGVSVTTVRIQLGAVASGGGSLRTVSAAAAMLWTPSTVVTDLQGNPASGQSATEGDALDRDF